MSIEGYQLPEYAEPNERELEYRDCETIDELAVAAQKDYPPIISTLIHQAASGDDLALSRVPTRDGLYDRLKEIISARHR